MVQANYNSVVATFCHNMAGFAHSNDPTVTLRLVYVDDVISAFIAALKLFFLYGNAEYSIKWVNCWTKSEKRRQPTQSDGRACRKG